MRLLRWLVIAVVALWLLGEIAVIPFAESRIEQGVAERNRDASSVDADIGTFPLIARVLVTGEAPKLTVTLDRVARQALTLAEVRFDLIGIGIDRSAILRGDARVESIDGGTVTATIEVGALGPVPSTGIDVRVSGRTLRAGRVAFEIGEDLVPCTPQARVDGDRVILSCTLTDVPQILLEAAQGG